jgi:AcrR family transcriptional regulator
MTEAKKRPYRSKLRTDQAAQTHAAILAAAGKEFRAHGWEKTTIASIARRAGVSAETVYAGFSNKRTLIAALVEETVRRGAPQTPVLLQQGPRAILGASDPASLIAMFAADIADVLSRVAPLMAVVRAAATAEPELAALYRQMHEGRKRNLSVVIQTLADKAALHADLDENSATALLWRLASPDLFTLMSDVEGIAQEAYATWLEQTLIRLLLPDP